MPNILLAGIDPGGTNGMVIAMAHIDPPTIVLEKKILLSVVFPAEVILHLTLMPCYTVFVERRASAANNPEGITPFEVITFALREQGYQMDMSVAIGKGALRLITPGAWKPFVKAQRLDLSVWKPSSQHEKDAIGILYYGIRMNFTQWEIQYV